MLDQSEAPTDSMKDGLYLVNRWLSLTLKFVDEHPNVETHGRFIVTGRINGSHASTTNHCTEPDIKKARERDQRKITIEWAIAVREQMRDLLESKGYDTDGEGEAL